MKSILKNAAIVSMKPKDEEAVSVKTEAGSIESFKRRVGETFALSEGDERKFDAVLIQQDAPSKSTSKRPGI